MSESIKLESDVYFDSCSTVHNRKNLKDYLNAKGKTLRCGLNDNQSILKNRITQINFDRSLNNNFGNNYENYFRLLGGKIEIMNSNISCVLVVASIQSGGLGSSNIYINSSTLGRFAVATCSASEGGVSATAIIPVTKNDKIWAEVYTQNDGQINNWTDMTFIEIASL